MKIRDKYLLIMAFVWVPCLAVAAASYVMVLRPQMDLRHELETKVSQAKDYYAHALEAAKPQRQALLTEQVDGMHNRIADFLVCSEDAPDLAFEIGTLAQDARLDSFGIKPVNTRTSSRSSSRQQLTEQRLRLNFLAGFTRFATFLNTLERHHPAVFVETFAIRRPLEADAQPQVEMELAVLVENPQGT